MIAIVTGAGSGIGRAAARALSEAGWTVVAAGRRVPPLLETLDGADGFAVSTDVADPASVDALFAAVLERYGRVDLLFNNAGVGLNQPVAEIAVEDWKRVVDTNLTGSFLCAQAAFRAMAAQDPRGGRIINNGSLSLDGREFDIACGQIDVGNAETELAARMASGVPQADGTLKAEPLMEVDEVGRAVAHMASLPLDANVLFMTVMATKMPFTGRG
jgi:NADP-dependent 3-hydroxy acid dehydrogenase YdfG